MKSMKKIGTRLVCGVACGLMVIAVPAVASAGSCYQTYDGFREVAQHRSSIERGFATAGLIVGTGAAFASLFGVIGVVGGMGAASTLGMSAMTGGIGTLGMGIMIPTSGLPLSEIVPVKSSLERALDVMDWAEGQNQNSDDAYPKALKKLYRELHVAKLERDMAGQPAAVIHEAIRRHRDESDWDLLNEVKTMVQKDLDSGAFCPSSRRGEPMGARKVVRRLRADFVASGALSGRR